MDQQLDITKVRKRLAYIVDQVKYRGQGCVITRHGQPAAAVVPMDVYLRWKKERDELFELIKSIQIANEGADPDQVMAEVLEAQQSLRRSLTA